jgi:hypothetical protein
VRFAFEMTERVVDHCAGSLVHLANPLHAEAAACTRAFQFADSVAVRGVILNVAHTLFLQSRMFA